MPVPADLEPGMTVAPTIAPDEAAGRAWDAAVVGAGPAGAIAARELARRGRSVLLIDKATFPRGKVCGCCLNGSALDTLAAAGLGDLAARCGAVPLERVRLAAGGRGAELPLPGGAALSRQAFDSALVRAAIAAGAHFLPATAAKLGRCAAGGCELLLVTRPGPGSQTGAAPPAVVRAGVVVAADGLGGQLAAGNRPAVAGGSRIGAGAVADAAPDFYHPRTIFMAVGRGGYVGLVRVEDGRLDVAAAFDPGFVRGSGGLGPAAAATLRDAGFPAVPGLEELPWRGTPALTRTARCVAGERWFAVGDAAGYVEPFTGEGMAWAVASAVAVAPIAARPWFPGLIREWEATYARLVRSRQTVCRAAAWVLRSPRLSRLAVRLLSVAPILSRPVVAALNRPARAPEPVA
jgi:flavin-dependent dehydrogenase